MKPCIHSGYCCQTAPCGFGEVTSPENPSCRFLGGSKSGEYFCTKYEEIVLGSPQNGAEISPAFGSGCCSPFNSKRLELIKKGRN